MYGGTSHNKRFSEMAVGVETDVLLLNAFNYKLRKAGNVFAEFCATMESPCEFHFVRINLILLLHEIVLAITSVPSLLYDSRANLPILYTAHRENHDTLHSG